MSADIRVARRYAQALYGAASSKGAIESVEGDLRAISEIVSRSPGFRAVFMSPGQSRDSKLALLDRTVTGKVDPLTLQLLKMLVEKRREELLPAIQARYVEVRRESAGILTVVVHSAMHLDASEQARIEKKIAAETGKQTEMEFEVDSKLIGGVTATYDNFMMDGSVRGGLARMRNKLKYELLKQA